MHACVGPLRPLPCLPPSDAARIRPLPPTRTYLPRLLPQLRQLEFENEELRRATRVKTETIAALRRELAARPALEGG